MTQSSHNAIVLKKDNENRFNQLFANAAKSETNALRFSEYFGFLLDRCLITNKSTLKNYIELFRLSVEKRYAKDPGSLNPLLQRTITRQQLIFLFNELSKKIFHNDKNHQDKLYNLILCEKAVAYKQSIHYARLMIPDQINRKMLMENAIQTLSEYEEELKSLFIIYVQENYWALRRKARILLTQREVELQNKRMSLVCFIRFLKEAQILPHLINIEHVEDLLEKIVPQSNQKQYLFYNNHFLVDCYSKDLDNPEIRSEGDPGLVFFQFQFALARIAVQISKQVDNAKKVYDYIINKFFKSYLYVRTNEQIKQHKKFPNINKFHLNSLQRYYAIINEDSDQDQLQQEVYEPSPLQIMAKKQIELINLKPLQLSASSILKVLTTQLPPLPQQIQVKQQNPPPFAPKFKDVEKIVIGQQPPPQKADKKGGQKQPPKKKPQLKKGQKPPRVFQYMSADEQTKKIGSSQDYLQKLATDLDYSLKPLSSLERGNIPLDPFPTIISQILYPPQIPQQVLPFIEAGLNGHNENKFALALQNYEKAHKLWKQQISANQLSPALELYFEFTKGTIYLSAGKDDYALQSFYNCRGFLEKMPYLSPDRALPYCGIGQVLYNAEQYQLAARAFLKARQIRQTLLSIQSVDTATVFNNLGCCFFMLDRTKEALSYFKVASTVLNAQLGQFHQRSQTSKQNIVLCNKSFYANIPQYRKLWQVYEKDPFGKKKKKKKKK